MKHLLTGVLLLLSVASFSQTKDFEISGQLVSEEKKEPLESATIYLQRVKDSSLVTYTISDKQGDFFLKDKTSDDKLNLYISYVGYKTYFKTISIDKKEIDLGEISLAEDDNVLDEVVIKSQAPVTVKTDTLEFNVASFKTKKDANVEDLLKKLPGVEVDSEGNITVNGKPVNKILVNGKPFFGDDPTIATRNLTKDIVDKIQVTDTKTESEAFTGEKGDDQNKTINITIDEEKNKGIFGRLAGGVGTDERFEYAGLVNYFDNDVRISLLGGGNNINTAGFSFGEIQKMYGGARYISVNSNGAINFGGRQFGGGQGITNSRTAGANYADDFGKNTELTTDYFYSAANSYNNVVRNRENILPDDRYFSNSSSSTQSNTDSHAANLKFKTQIDSTFLINIRPQFKYNIGNSNYSNTEETTRLNGELTNRSNTQRNSDNIQKSFENNLNLTKKYGTGGGFFKLNIDNEIENSDLENKINSITEVYGDDPETITRNQFTDGEQSSNQYEIKPEFRLPILSKTLYFDLEYAYKNDKRKDRQSVFDFDETAQDFSNFNIDQSTDFTNTDRTSRPEAGLRYNDKKLRAGINAGYVMRTLASEDALRDINFENDFNALELSANLSYQFSQKFRMYSGYYLRNTAPSVSQLSPYVDVSDPLNIVQGNPDLRPSNSNNVYLGLRNFDFQTKSGIYGYFNAQFSQDRVVPKTTVDNNFVRRTTYANVDGYYSIHGNGRYSKTIKLDSVKSIKYRVGGSVNANRNVNFNNNVQYASRTITYSPFVSFSFIWDRLFEIEPSYRVSLNKNTFNINLFEDRTYVVHDLKLETITTFPEKLEWNNDITYSYNTNIAPGFQKDAIFWNTTLSYSVMKDKGLITLKAYDLLNQNTNARRTSTQDYIEDVQSTVLQRYFMVGFSYKFNTLGKKGETRGGDFWFD
ncbi:outer membrane beta-barrel protein [Marixanthomonas spongiae]|uniref:TonB-dependent receptor n=1 Tax=Marixanthomonas spongiae TaxID=2174845 RepID=A0A2U0I7Q0_9FLAO|nr:outer membrane beta-barrel protein [Marixanthomonas spongiae]PVW17129.1 TonB-dependent receptor [Marixanthomonas spongiae]